MTTARRLSPTYSRPASAHPAIAPEDLTLAAAGSAPALAVLFARRTAIVWGFASSAGLAETVTAELVTRAIGFTRTGQPQPLTGILRDPPPLVGVRLTIVRAGLLLEVWDHNSTNPLPADPGNLDDRLKIVHECAGRWNYYRAPGGGKVIWAEITNRHNTIDDPIPHREPGAYSFPESPNPPEREMRPAVVRAVATGLRELDGASDPAIPGKAG